MSHESDDRPQAVIAPLYKFSSCGGAAKILENCSLWAKSPLDFNDPFEVLPAFDEERKNMAINSKKDAFRELGLPHRGRLTPHGNEHEIPVEDFVDLQRNYHERFFSAIYPRFRVLCFSERAEPILLWSHYAESHKGIAIGFDVNRGDFPRGITPNGIPVNYIENRDSLVLPLESYRFGLDYWTHRDRVRTESAQTAAGMDDLKTLLAHKYNVWSYEAERRFLYDLKSDGNGGLSDSRSDKAGTKYNSACFDREAVIQIVFGYHCDADSISQLRSRIASFPQATLHYVDFHPTKYEVRLFRGSFEQILSIHGQRRQGHRRIRSAAE
jgi:hypothetical protein